MKIYHHAVQKYEEEKKTEDSPEDTFEGHFSR